MPSKVALHSPGEKSRSDGVPALTAHIFAEDSSNTSNTFYTKNARSTIQFYGVMIAFCLAYFSNQYSIAIVAVHLYAIGEVFNDYKQVVWFVNGASVGVFVLGPIIFHYATVKTRKWFILLGLLAGIGGQLIAGLARGMHILIVGQALVGITLATQPLLVMIPVELLSQKHRKLAQTLSNIAGGLGGICGAVVGGGTVNSILLGSVVLRFRRNIADSQAGDAYPWQWLFRLAAILYGFTFILLSLMYRTRPLEVCAEAERGSARFDWAGMFLLTAGVVPLVIGISIGGEPMPWNTLPVILPLVCGGTCLSLFVTWELWGTSTGLFRHELFKRGRNFPIALMLSFLEGILFVVFLVWYNQEIYVLFEMRPLTQGSRFVIFYGIITILAPVIASYYSRKKSVRLPLISGFLFVMVASILMATLTSADSKITILYSALAAIGLTAPLVLLVTTIHLCAPPKLACVVAPLAVLIRTMGIITGNVLSNAIINSRFNTLLSQSLTESLLKLNISAEDSTLLFQALRMRNTDLVVTVASTLGLPPQALQIVENLSAKAQLDAFRVVWVIIASLACLAAIGCIAMTVVDEVQHNTASTQTAPFSFNLNPNVGPLNPNGPWVQYDESRGFAVLDIRRDPEKMEHDYKGHVEKTLTHI